MGSVHKDSIMKKRHQWHSATQGFGRRFAFGSAVALSLTLVAFEWTTTRPDEISFYLPMDDEPFFEVVPVFKIERKVEQGTKAVEPRKRKTGGAIVIVTEPVPVPQPEPVDPITPDPGIPISPEPLPPGDDLKSTGLIDMPTPTLNPEVLPHFERCLNDDLDRTNECTEDRILRHLERNLEIPPTVIGSVFTTVTFEIDAQGRIGRTHCAPKVDREVEEEIDRAIRSLPRFIPGSQGGHPVPVYYQIPLRLRKG